MIVFANDWADPDVATGAVSGLLGDDINAEVSTVGGRQFEDLRKPLLCGLIVPFGDIHTSRRPKSVPRDSGKADRVRVAEDAVGWPCGGVGPSGVGTDERKLAG